MTLLICRTCPRYEPRCSGDFGRALTSAIAETGAAVEIRNVHCLGGCPRDGVVAVDGPGKARVRFAALGLNDIEAILEAAAAYEASGTGAPGDWQVPESLADRVSSVTLKREPRSG
jgi:predicted metal-binding protein